MIFHNGNIYNLNDPDLQNFTTNTQLDTQPQNKNLPFCYNIYYGDKNQRDIVSLEIGSFNEYISKAN